MLEIGLRRQRHIGRGVAERSAKLLAARDLRLDRVAVAEQAGRFRHFAGGEQRTITLDAQSGKASVQ